MAKRKDIDWNEYRRQILEKLNLEAEFIFLGIKITGKPGDDGWAPCHAIDREDHTPSAAVNFQSGHYIDRGGIGLSLSFFDLCVQQKRFPIWTAARDHYAAVAGIAMNGDAPKDPAENLAFKPWNRGTTTVAAIWCLKKKGATVEAIQAAGGRVARYFDQFTVIALPIYGAGLLDAEPSGWVLWNTSGLELPVYRGKEKPKSWIKMKTTGASEMGLIGRHALGQLAAAGPESKFLIWKVEGPSDLLTLWAKIPPDKRSTHLVLTNAGGATENPKPWMTTIFSGHQVAIAGDADAPGYAGAEKWAAWAARVAEEVRIVKLPYPVEPSHGKDIRDFLTETEEVA